MIGIIIVGHGNFAEGLFSSANLILGVQENVKCINFNEADSSNDLCDKILIEIDKMNNTEGIIFLTDLAGGTPFNNCVLISQNIENYKVIAGTNLPLLIEIIMKRDSTDIDNLINHGIFYGKEGLVSFVKDKESNKATKFKVGI